MNHKRAKKSTRTATKLLAGIGAGALGLHLIRFGMEVFGPTRPYRLLEGGGIRPDSDEFAYRLALLSDALLHRNARIHVLKNGKEFYPRELEAIDNAKNSINLEAFEFFEGDVTREFLERMARRAREGVQVRLIIDRFGSWNTSGGYFDSLRNAGGRVVFYHPVTLQDLPYLDHRTHRKLLTIDGQVGFIGGAGFADHWIKDVKGRPPWRDTVLQVEGSVVGTLNSTFSQNWASATGEVLFGEGQFPEVKAAGDKTCLVVMSTPGYGATRARILFQTLIEAAQRSIVITSPYFLPDRSARHALIRAARDRGVHVRVLTNGKHSDHSSARRLSEALSVKLIRAGVEYYEYAAGMIHAKILAIDGNWTIAGSTNFDYRSFALNDEVNIAVCDREIAGIVERQFEEDLTRSCRLTDKTAKSQKFTSEILAGVGWVLRREE